MKRVCATFLAVALVGTTLPRAQNEKPMWDSPIPLDKVRAMVRDLEADPLGKYAEGLRAILLQYFDNMRPEFEVCVAQFKPLLDSKDEKLRDFYFQIPIASGMYLLDHPGDLGNKQAYQLAGVEGMLRVYETELKAKPKRHNKFLDDLVAQREAGTLGEFIRTHSCDDEPSAE